MTKPSALVFLAALAGTASAQDIDSGPKAGEKLSALRAFGVVGSVEGTEADYTADRKDAPTVFVFVQSEHFGRPAARFLKKLDEQVRQAKDKVAVVAVWLGDKATFEKNKDYLPRAQASLKFENTALAAFDGEKSGPNGWGVNPDAHLTVVVADRGMVTKTFAYLSVNETDVRAVLAALKGAK